MPGNARNALAALAAGLSTVGENINRRKDRKAAAALEEQQAETASKRALQNLLAVEVARDAGRPEWEQEDPFEVDAGNGATRKIVTERNRKTGERRIATIPRSLLGPTTNEPSPDAGMAALTGGVQNPPPISASLQGNPNPVTPTRPIEQAPRMLGQRLESVPLMPYQKDAAPKTDPLAEYMAKPQRVQVADGKGGMKWAWLKPGQEAEGYVKPPSVAGGAPGGGFGAGGIGGAGRTLAGIAGLHTAHDSMTPYENSIASGQATFDGLDYYKTLMGKMYDSNGIVDPAIHATAMAHLGSTNPDLANYLQNAELWALEESMLSNRPSDFRTKLDAFVSTLKPNASQQMIQGIQNARAVRISGWDKSAPALEAQLKRVTGTAAGSPATAPATPAKKTPAQLWDEAVKIHGREKVLKEYGPRPPG